MGVYSYDSLQQQLIPVAGAGPNMVGATATEDGVRGTAPAPVAGEQDKFLRGDGTWAKAAADDNFVGTLAEWNVLTAEQKTQYKTADITDDFNGMPLDDTLSLTSEHPVQNKAIAQAFNSVEKLKIYEVTIPVISLPYTLTDPNITDDMVVVNSTQSVPAEQTGDWTVVTSNGSLAISGSKSGSTQDNVTLYLGCKRQGG